jgi:DNA-binding HxlR family transcriptional regulator
VRQQPCECCTDGVIDLIGKKWTLCILVTLGNSLSLRFNALLNRLSGISPRTLSDTLQELSNQGVILRQVFAEAPPRVEYSLTDEGRRLRRAIVPLMEWAVAHNTYSPTSLTAPRGGSVG